MGHGHSHGIVDPALASTADGLRVLQWSFAGLLATAAIQVVVVALSGSVALLADTIHNFADALTSVPLAVAFWLARRASTRRFPYGLGRVEDLAGIAIVAMILLTGFLVAWESLDRLLHPRHVEMLWAVALASLVGFAGNEAVAVFRIRVGRRIGSAALVADGYHARLDGWTSLSVLVGAGLVTVGYPLADPALGLVISLAILWLALSAGRTIVVRMIDGVEAATLDRLAHAAYHTAAVEEVTDARARWVGHALHAELNITVRADLTVAEGHRVAEDVRHALLHHVPNLGKVTIHVDPSGKGGERHHRIERHAHDGLPEHSHP